MGGWGGRAAEMEMFVDTHTTMLIAPALGSQTLRRLQ